MQILYSFSMAEFAIPINRVQFCFRYHRLLRSWKATLVNVDLSYKVSPKPNPRPPVTSIKPTPEAPSPSGHLGDLKQSYRQKFYDYVKTDPGFRKSISTSSTGELSKLKEQLRSLFFVRSAVFQGQAHNETDTVLKGRLDNQTAIALPTCSLDEALSVMDLWTSVSDLDKRVPKSFKVFLDKLATLDQPFTIPQTLQILFYCAIYRKLTPVVKGKLRRIICDNASALDSLQLELVCFAFYVLKVDCRDFPKFLSTVAERILEEPFELKLAITALKFLRQNNFVDLNFFQKLSRTLPQVDMENEVGSVECCHLLQTFVSAKFYDERLFQRVHEKVLKDIQTQTELYAGYSTDELIQMHPSQRLRIKDLANFLYSLAVINHTIGNVDIIITDLKNRLEGGEYNGMPYFLVQSVYALSLQGIYDIQLLAGVFSEETVWKLVQGGWKDAQRWLYCLYKNCQIEFPEGIKVAEVSEARLQNGLPKDFFNMGFEMSCRDEKLIEVVRKDLAKEYGNDAVSFRRQIPHVEVSGFDVRVSSAANLIAQLSKVKSVGNDSSESVSDKLHFDVLDPGWTRAANMERPLGIVVLKQRLLDLTGWKTRIRKNAKNPKTNEK